jgi:hypothetical protein
LEFRGISQQHQRDGEACNSLDSTCLVLCCIVLFVFFVDISLISSLILSIPIGAKSPKRRSRLSRRICSGRLSSSGLESCSCA